MIEHVIQVLVVSSIHQGAINWLVCIYWGYNVAIFQEVSWTCQSFPENLHHTDLSILALRVVTAIVLVVLCGFLIHQIVCKV